MGCSSSKTATETVVPTPAVDPVVRKSPPSVETEETRPESPATTKEQTAPAVVKPVAELVAETAEPVAQKATEAVTEKVEPVAEQVPHKATEAVTEKVEPVAEQVPQKATEAVTDNVEPVAEKVIDAIVVTQEKVEEPVTQEKVEEPVTNEKVEEPVTEEKVEEPAAEAIPVEEPVAAPTMSPEAQKAHSIALDAQKCLLEYYSSGAFTSQGKAGAVELSMLPQTETERQVVCGKMSFGALFTAEEVKEFLMDITVKPSWDGMFQDGKNLESFIDEKDRSLSTSWAAYKKQMGVAGRDFIYVTLCEVVGDKIVISTRSMDLPEYPEGKFLSSHCRGTIDNAGYILETVNGEVVVSFYNQMNPGGSVPTWIVNRVQMKQPSSLSETFKALKKRAGK